MSFSYKAGVGLVPTLARIVLGLAFITIGYHKIANTVDYTAEQAQTLNAIGVELEPLAASAAENNAALQLDSSTAPALLSASFSLQDAEPDAEPTQDAPATDPQDDNADSAADVDDAFIVTADSYRGKAMWNVALMLEANSFPEPKIMAMVAAWTEFVGGILILLGFLARIWGLGLAIAMGVAFYLTSMDAYLFPFPSAMFDVAATDTQTFNRVFAQLALLVLGLGVFLTGPGPISLDRLLFPGKSSRYGDDDPESNVQL